MLQQFTWTDFLMVVMPLMAVWYVWLFLFYDKGSRKVSVSDLASVRDAGSRLMASGVLGAEGTGFEAADDLMGKSRMPQGMSRVGTSDIVFSGEGFPDGQEPGLVMDVITELKDLFALLAREDGSKQDFFRLVSAVKQAYPGIGSHPGIAVINAFVVEHAPFLISLQELESLWD